MLSFRRLAGVDLWMPVVQRALQACATKLITRLTRSGTGVSTWGPGTSCPMHALI